ncbi:host attachment protein [Phenylobacterium sp. J426]|uniref:host attachment protein n=1 Tax=Phenylobacterium sp. J426 TaxID=2898439 RepID=UPI002150CA14|nr:host attachment protein [Phenylobacterium sp. J426]MCR5876167.1 host attachment protein [Phenylobacterium sp. J426]
MELTGTTWIVAADAVEARVFEERVRAGEVRERKEMRLQSNGEDEPKSHRHMTTVHESGGPGRHGAGARDMDHESERRFLRRVAAELEAAAKRGAFERLALMAPPRALGLLRAELGAACARRLDVCDAHERVHDDAEAIRRRLREARARA